MDEATPTTVRQCHAFRSLAEFGAVGQKVTGIRAIDWADLPHNWTRKIFDRKSLNDGNNQ